MEREAFEQLVSQWLDDRERGELRAQIDAAVASDPRLADILAEWRTFDDAIRAACPPLGDKVAWSRLRARVGEQVAAEERDSLADRRLREATRVDDRVDWDALRARVMDAVSAVDRKTAVRPTAARRRFLALAYVGAAAAALLLVALFIPRASAPSRVGVVEVAVNNAPPAPSDGFAAVRVSAPPEGEASPAEPNDAEAPRVAEVFLMVTPAPAADRASGSLSSFGFN